MIYFDPPFNSDRDYILNYENDLGFNDKWTDDDYTKFIKIMIDNLYEMLDNDGTLYFHIIIVHVYSETILRKKFKYVEPIFLEKV